MAGRGGAGFPTGVKWKAVLEADGTPKTIVCNADEGEPGCFKDRALLDHDPHAVIEGMLLAALATGAERGFIYLRYEYPASWKRLRKALEEARAERLLGTRILDSDFEFDIFLRRGAGAYICGEEGSLLNSLEGKHPFPRNRPPFPVTHGYEGLPTVVNNVETLASVPPIVVRGAKWYRSLGLGESCRYQGDQPLRRHPASGQLRGSSGVYLCRLCSNGPVGHRRDIRFRQSRWRAFQGGFWELNRFR